MNYSRLILFTLLLFIACQEEVVLTFSSEVFTEDDLEICRDEPCSAVTLDYPIATGDADVSAKINSEIENYMIEGLFLGEDDGPSATDLKDAVTQFIMAYRDHQPDLPTELDLGGYEADISIRKNPPDRNSFVLPMLQIPVYRGSTRIWRYDLSFYLMLKRAKYWTLRY